MKNMTKKRGFQTIKQAISVSVALMVICGFLFPLALSGLSGILFPEQSNGDLVYVDGKAVGSKHVGQDFTKEYFMKGRPSAYHYNTYVEDEKGNQTYVDGSEFAGLSSGSNNYGNSNPALKERVEADVEKVLEANPGLKREDIPLDLVTASGSGLDPHISVNSANVQIPQLAKASGLSEEKLQNIVKENTENPLFGIFGEEIVNVLGVNVDIAQEMGLIK